MPTPRQAAGGSQMTANPNTATIARVRVLIAPNNGLLTVQLISETNSSLGQRNVTFLKGQRPPAVGAIGAIVYVPSGGSSRAYWLGEEYVASQTIQQQTDVGTAADEVFLHNDDNTATLKVSRNLVNIANQYFGLTGNNTQFALRSNSNTMTLNSTNFEVMSSTYRLKLGPSSLVQTTSSLSLVGSQGLKLVTSGDLVISGGINNPSGATILQQHAPINNLLIKANDARLALGGMTVIDGSALTLNLTSRMLIDPGNNTTFRLSVIQGNAIITLGTGDLDLNTLGPISFAALTAGSLTTGIYSRVKVNRLRGEFRNFTAGVLAEVKVGPAGKLSISADTELDMSATVSFSLSSSATGSVSTDGKLDISAIGKLTLESDIMAEIKALTLKLSGSNIIMLGSPRVSNPNPALSGGWCAIPMCPFAQIAHCGDILTGAG